MNLEQHLKKFIHQPDDPNNNYNLGLCYEEIGHTTSAYSYFLRTAEFSDDSNLIYNSLLKCSLCLGKQTRHKKSEKGMILHAMNVLPNRPEAYFILSQYHEIMKNWNEAYNMACMGLNIKEEYPGNFDVGYPGYYGLLFQKAVSSWWVGRKEESIKLINQLIYEYEYEMSEFYKEVVHTNFVFLNSNEWPSLPYNSLIQHKLKYKFNGFENIKQNYSQAYQDMFVLSMLNGKNNGTYLEIGSADPFKSNNTALLETLYNWNGISIDYNEKEVEKFKKERNNVVYNLDATQIDYTKLMLENKLGTEIDYLQLDCEPPAITYEVLTKIPFDTHKFAVITYEHDYYTDKSKEFKGKSRKLLKSHGYELIGSNIAPNETDDFEDWWVHPDLVSDNISKMFKNSDKNIKKATDFMLKKY